VCPHACHQNEPESTPTSKPSKNQTAPIHATLLGTVRYEDSSGSNGNCNPIPAYSSHDLDSSAHYSDAALIRALLRGRAISPYTHFNQRALTASAPQELRLPNRLSNSRHPRSDCIVLPSAFPIEMVASLSSSPLRLKAGGALRTPRCPPTSPPRMTACDDGAVCVRVPLSGSLARIALC